MSAPQGSAGASPCLSFHLSGVDGLRLRSVNLRLGLSRLYEARVRCVLEGLPEDLSAWLRKPALITRHTDAGDRLLQGHVRAVCRLPAEGRWQGIELVIVPAHWWMTQRVRRRQHVDVTGAEIIPRLCREAGPETGQVQFSLHRPPAKRTSVMQLDESDWAFAERLMAEEGWSYTFDHSPQGHTLVISDHGGLYHPVPDPWCRLGSEDGIRANQNVSDRSRQRACVGIGGVRVSGWDPARPHVFLGEDAGEREPETFRHLYSTRAHEGDLAQAARQALAGFNATVDEIERVSPRPDLDIGLLLKPAGQDDLWVVSELDYTGHVEGTTDALSGTLGSRHRNLIRLRPESTRILPQSVPSRLVAGPMGATVWGQETARSHTRTDGTVRAAWLWDEHARPGPWMRVDQGWAGDRRGTCVLPRTGQEALVDFENGDPACPVVLGSLFHGGHRPPVAAAEADQIRLRSALISEGAQHELTLDDRSGEEKLALNVAGEWRLHVTRDRISHVRG
ncbi:MAG: type VI secretion system tip protein VgrG, partial [Gammaproteobacteria bacterium]